MKTASKGRQRKQSQPSRIKRPETADQDVAFTLSENMMFRLARASEVSTTGSANTSLPNSCVVGEQNKAGGYAVARETDSCRAREPITSKEPTDSGERKHEGQTACVENRGGS